MCGEGEGGCGREAKGWYTIHMWIMLGNRQPNTSFGLSVNMQFLKADLQRDS